MSDFLPYYIRHEFSTLQIISRFARLLREKLDEQTHIRDGSS